MLKCPLRIYLLLILCVTTGRVGAGCPGFDNRWEALTLPQLATQFFCLEPLPPFEIDAKAYSPVNAWWLAEVSRIIYKEGKGPLRNHYLAKAGLKETEFFDEDAIQCALVESTDLENRFNVLVFRGTGDVSDWLKNFDVELIDFEGGGRVHKGFYHALMQVWSKLEPKLAKLEGPVYYCGHSLGAALATVAAAQAETKPVGVYAYGSPRVGDAEFAKSLEGIAIFRFVNHLDVVTTVPPKVKFLQYEDVGNAYYITHDNHLWVDPNDVIIAEDRGLSKRVFDKEVDRHLFYDPPEAMGDHAPVNYSEHLRREYLRSRGDSK